MELNKKGGAAGTVRLINISGNIMTGKIIRANPVNSQGRLVTP